MVPGWKRASRALRLLLVCAAFWLAAGSPGKGLVEQRAVAVMIAPVRAPALRRVASRSPKPSATVFERLPAPELAQVGAELVLIEDRYLRFCSLLS